MEIIEKYNKPPKTLVWLLIVFFAATPCDYALPRFFGKNATILYVLGIAICAACFADLFLGREKKLFLPTDNAAIIFLCLLACVSLIWAEDFNRGKNMLISLAAIVVMYFLLFLYKYTKEEIKRIEIASILGGLYMVLFIFTQVDLSLVSAGYRLDLYTLSGGAYSDPNSLSARLVMPMVFCFKYIFESKKKLLKLFLLAEIGGIVYIMFLTGSRAAVITLAIVIFAILMKNLSGKRACLAFIMVFAVFIALSIFSNLLPQHLYVRIFNIESYTAMASAEGDRFDIWKNVFTRVFPESPLLGHGIGNAPVAMEPIYGKIKAIHNAFFVYLVDLGIIGFLLWMVFVVGKVKTAIKLRKKYIYPSIIILGTVIMACTLNAEIEKYLWNSFLYVHMVATSHNNCVDSGI